MRGEERRGEDMRGQGREERRAEERTTSVECLICMTPSALPARRRR